MVECSEDVVRGLKVARAFKPSIHSDKPVCRLVNHTHPPGVLCWPSSLPPRLGVLVCSVCAFLHYLQICAVRTGIVWMPRILVSGI